MSKTTVEYSWSLVDHMGFCPMTGPYTGGYCNSPQGALWEAEKAKQARGEELEIRIFKITTEELDVSAL